MKLQEVSLNEEVLAELIGFSKAWEAENSCYGYHANGRENIASQRIFLATEGKTTLGYLLGHMEQAEKASSIMPQGTPYFEVEELYVSPAYRSQGIGKALFCFVKEAVQGEAQFMLLSTATKNWRSILHFYIDELGMEFWSARLWQKI